jgi:alpha-tubulin suppressor-like RCC1 family protein
MIRPFVIAALCSVLAGCRSRNEPPPEARAVTKPAPDAGLSASASTQRPEPVKQIVAGKAHTCVLFENGKVRCWGIAAGGQLGTGTTSDVGGATPASQGHDVELGGPAQQIAAGAGHTCALMLTGDLRCWGGGTHGQLGYGNPNNVGDDELPAQVGDVPLDEKVVQVGAGGENTCVILASNRIRCWGAGAQNKLGDGSMFDVGDDEPVLSIPAHRFDQKVVQVALDGASTCVLFANGKVRCWGAVGGPEPHDSRDAASRPDVELGVAASALGAGPVSHHVCAITASSRLRCWGLGGPGALGYDIDSIGGERETRLPTPAKAGDVRGIEDVAQVATGADHTCVLSRAGKMRCWGSNAFGQLGSGKPSVMPQGGPVLTAAEARDLKLPAIVTQIATGAYHTCALLVGGAVKCWGMGEYGRLGYGNYDDKWDAAAVADVPL